MASSGFFRNKWTYIVGVPVLLIVIFVGGPFVYINFIRDDAPDRLELSTETTRADTSDTTTSTTSISGEWTVVSGSTVGYRAQEVLFGQTADAAGRTTDITGTLTLRGTNAESAEFTADLTTLESDSDNRDNQVQGRILETDQFPEATFTLTQPIDLNTVPEDLVEITTPATGDLTVHGVTKSVTFDLTARRNGDKIEVNGSIPIVWSDYEIDSPSGGPAQVEDSGEMEFLITFERT